MADQRLLLTLVALQAVSLPRASDPFPTCASGGKPCSQGQPVKSDVGLSLFQGHFKTRPKLQQLSAERAAATGGGAGMLKRVLTKENAKKGGQAFGREAGLQVATNVAFTAVAMIPGSEKWPFVGNMLGGHQDDKSNNDIAKELTSEIRNGVRKIQGQLTRMDAGLKAEMRKQADALKTLVEGSTELIMQELADNAEENLKVIASFRKKAEQNHEEVMAGVTKQLFETTYRQCLEYSTDIHVKYDLYQIVINDMLGQRRETLRSGSWFPPGEFGSVDGCAPGFAWIDTQELCQEASEHLGYGQPTVGHYAGDYPGCMVRPSTGDTWFNTHPDPAGTWSVESAGQLCVRVDFKPGKFGSVDGCADGMVGIFSEALCRKAATVLGYGQPTVGHYAGDYPGCMVRPSTGEIWYNTHPSPAGTWQPESAGQLCRAKEGNTEETLALLLLREADMLHSFLSSSAMGTVSDAQRLTACFLPTEWSTSSLLGKFIAMSKERDDDRFVPSARLSAVRLMADFLETSLMSVDLQDVHLTVVDRLSLPARMEFVQRLGGQLEKAWTVLRRELHEAQPDLQFLPNVDPNVAVIEYGASDPGLAEARCPPLGLSSGSQLEFGYGFVEHVGVWDLEGHGRQALQKCKDMPNCNEATVWAIRHCEEHGSTAQYARAIHWRWSDSEEVRALGCGALHPDAVQFSGVPSTNVGGSCNREEEDKVVAVAAFYLYR